MNVGYEITSEIEAIRNNAPIMIFLQYDKINLLKFPVNPEELKKIIPSDSNKVNVEGIGEVASPGSTKLASTTITSFFWQDRNLVPSSFYIDWLEIWQRSKKPAKLIVTRFNFSMYVTCESFWHSNKAGEENDIYFELQLQEYRPFGAKKLNQVVNPKFFDKMLNFSANKFSPILIEIPRPTRIINKLPMPNPYITKIGDTILSITKKATGTTTEWKNLYELNKELLGDVTGEFIMPAGLKLVIPSEWKRFNWKEGTFNV